MEQKYQIPNNLFIIMEKTTPIVYSSDVLNNNHYIIFINEENFYFLNIILKNEYFCGKSILVEASAIDTLNYNKLNENIPIFDNQNRIITYYAYYLYTVKVRLTIVLHRTINKTKSIDLIYKNANWLERELSEMYGIYYSNKKDSRKLLLDYTKDENPMLKDFPCEGFTDTFFNFFEEQIITTKSNSIEL